MSIQQRYAESIDAGYSNDEILQFLSEKPEYADKLKSSREAGYSDSDIISFISGKEDGNEEQNQDSAELDPQEDASSSLNKVARSPAQYALGVAETAALPYEMAVAPLANKDSQNVAYRELLMDDLEQMQMQKNSGVWDEKDEELLQHTIEQIKDPEKSAQFVQTADLGVQGLAEKATGLDLEPEGAIEKAARWSGWIKNPKNIMKLAKSGISMPQLAKAVMPSKTEAFRGVAAGNALQAAEDGEMGPIGTIALAVTADIAAGKLPGGMHKLGEGIGKVIADPKKAAAELAASFTSADKKALQKTIIEDFNKSGIQADLGTITDSNLIRWTQSRISQSGLVGKDLKKFSEQLSKDIEKEYKEIANNLGEMRFTTTHEAGQSTKDLITKIRDKDLEKVREIYSSVDDVVEKNAKVFSHGVRDKINELEKKLKPGEVKSGEQKIVLKTIKDVKKDVYKHSKEGSVAGVKDLINNKLGIQDIINYEAQGGAKKLLKSLVYEIDQSIMSYEANNEKFGKLYPKAKKEAQNHIKTFRNKNIDQILKSEDPSSILNKLNSTQGIRDVGKALGEYSEGKALFNDLKRYKLDQLIGDNLIDGVTKQAKLGTFSKLLEKGKNREIVKELLGATEFNRLQKLQSNAGQLSNSANKFFNSSQSATTALDAAAIMTLFSQAGHLLYGNPWPIARGVSSLGGAFGLSKLLSDPKFLKLTEEAIRASNSKNPKKMQIAFDKLIPYAQQFKKESEEKKPKP